MADPVQLTDLDLITRYSIAVRQASAQRSELIAILRSDLEWLQAGLPEPTLQRTTRKTATKAVAKKAAAKRAPAKATRKRTLRGNS